MYNVKQKPLAEQVSRLEHIIQQKNKDISYLEEQSSIYYNAIAAIQGVLYDDNCPPNSAIREIRRAVEIMENRLNPKKVKKSENSY